MGTLMNLNITQSSQAAGINCNYDKLRKNNKSGQINTNGVSKYLFNENNPSIKQLTTIERKKTPANKNGIRKNNLNISRNTHRARTLEHTRLLTF